MTSCHVSKGEGDAGKEEGEPEAKRHKGEGDAGKEEAEPEGEAAKDTVALNAGRVRAGTGINGTCKMLLRIS